MIHRPVRSRRHRHRLRVLVVGGCRRAAVELQYFLGVLVATLWLIQLHQSIATVVAIIVQVFQAIGGLLLVIGRD